MHTREVLILQWVSIKSVGGDGYVAPYCRLNLLLDHKLTVLVEQFTIH
jgi:hypothetical protein